MNKLLSIVLSTVFALLLTTGLFSAKAYATCSVANAGNMTDGNRRFRTRIGQTGTRINTVILRIDPPAASTANMAIGAAPPSEYVGGGSIDIDRVERPNGSSLGVVIHSSHFPNGNFQRRNINDGWGFNEVLLSLQLDDLACITPSCGGTSIDATDISWSSAAGTGLNYNTPTGAFSNSFQLVATDALPVTTGAVSGFTTYTRADLSMQYTNTAILPPGTYEATLRQQSDVQ
ncbi:hypothetical protein [Candidatus Thioglobus sp.]|uniref:hypothetical protein n=1 Tax=Candidatus Thioglobus sp. TaxID=2026721 RepID=UPI003D0B1D9E